MSGPKLELPGFSGGIDELLFLVERGEVDMASLPLSPISDRVLDWIKKGKAPLDEAAAFLIKALILLDRKLTSILPPEQPAAELAPPPAGSAEGDNPAAGLAERLAAYKAFKDVASVLRRYEEEQAQRYIRQPEGLVKPAPLGVNLEDLLSALQRVWERLPEAETKEVEGEGLTVAMCCEVILNRLSSSGEACFSDLFAGHTTRREVVVTFLALLELFRQGLVTLRQDVPYGEIYIAVAAAEVKGVQAR